MTKKVLLTGVAGFVGSHILKRILTQTDWTIVGVAAWEHMGTPERVEQIIADDPCYEHLTPWKDRVQIITHDLTAPFPELTKKRIGQCDYILNVAAESHVDRSIDEPVHFVKNNTNVALTMLEFAREYKPEVFLQFSTDEVYGVAPQGHDHAEWEAIVPSNPYSASKACQEAIAISYWRTYGVPLIITNTMNIFGPMQAPEKYLAKIIRMVETGESVPVHGREGQIGSRYYLHATNMADAVMFILKNLPPTQYKEEDVLKPDRYNIVGDKEVNNLEMAQAMAKIMGKELVYHLEDFHAVRPGHDRRYALDGTKLKSLGWVAPLNFEDSLKDYIEWTKEHELWL